MKRTNLLLISFLTILLISVLHYSALKEHWYFTHRWLDIIMHLLGGFWVAVSTIYLFSFQKTLDIKKRKFIIIFSSVVFIGIIWEIFELLSGNTFIHTLNFYTDSASDMLNNIIGATLAYLIFNLNQNRSENNESMLK